MTIDGYWNIVISYILEAPFPAKLAEPGLGAKILLWANIISKNWLWMVVGEVAGIEENG